MNMRDLTVLIPSWNDAEALSVTLTAFASLPAELRDRLDIVVSDGASKDHTLKVLAAHADLVRHVSSRPDHGVYDAMNRGLSGATGSHVWVVGAGDVPDQDGLAHALAVMGSDKSPTAHAWSVAALPPLEPGVPARFEPDWGERLTWKNTMHHQGLVAPRAWLESHPFDPSLNILGDYAQMLEWRNMGHHVACHPERILCRVAPAGLSRTFNVALYREEWRMKRARLEGPRLWAQPFWLVAKWAFKQVSTVAKI